MKTISIFIAFISFMLFIWTLIRFKQDKLSWGGTLFWCIIWIAVGVFSLFPQLLDYLMALARMQNRMFFLFVVSITLLFIIVYYLYISQRKSERMIARLTQEIAILEYKIREYTKSKDQTD